MGAINTYKDLIVWQKARELVKLTYNFTASFPESEKFGLTNQMRRASVSIPSNIAEGYNRRSTKDYINFLSIAYGSLAELETQYVLSLDLGFLNESNYKKSADLIIEIQKILTTIRNSLLKKIKNAA